MVVQFSSFLSGIVTDASLMVNGRTAREAARTAERLGLPLGLHLNLTEGTPVAGSTRVPSLVDRKTGLMLGKFGFRRALAAGEISMDDLRIEVQAQLDRFRDLVGHPVTHLDGHQHVHVLPAVVRTLMLVLELREKIAIRIPEMFLAGEGSERWGTLGKVRKEFYETVSRQASEARGSLERSGCVTTDGFVGFALSGSEMTEEALVGAIEAASSAGMRSLEVMVHPGWRTTVETVGECKESRRLRDATTGKIDSAGLWALAGCGAAPDDFSASPDREQELRTLCIPSLRLLYPKVPSTTPSSPSKILLSSFPQLRTPTLPTTSSSPPSTSPHPPHASKSSPPPSPPSPPSPHPSPPVSSSRSKVREYSSSSAVRWTEERRREYKMRSSKQRGGGGEGEDVDPVRKVLQWTAQLDEWRPRASPKPRPTPRSKPRHTPSSARRSHRRSPYHAPWSESADRRIEEERMRFRWERKGEE